MIRGIRGATSIDSNATDAILSGTKELLKTIFEVNNIQIDDIASIFFSATKDLNREFPAKAAREMGLTYTPLLCLNEIEIPGRLSKCIRVLIHVNTDIPQKEIQHVYLKNAIKLRPDQALQNPISNSEK